LGNFFRTYVKSEWATYLALVLLWPISAILVLVNLARRQPTRADAMNAIAEALLVLVVLSMVPGLLIALPGGAAGYFSDVSAVVGVSAFAGLAPLLLEGRAPGSHWRTPLPVMWTLTAFVTVGLTAGAGIKVLAVYRERVELRRAEFGVLTSSSGATPMLAALTRLRNLPFRDRSVVLVDIPSSYAPYWGLAACAVSPFVMPAWSGFAFLDGRPERCGPRSRGYFVYAPRDPSAEYANRPPCDRRPDPRFRYIVSLAPGNNDWNVVDCLNQSGSR
jgi:hypothetical protein